MFDKTITQQEKSSRNLTFHGTGSEFFGIWIVNVLMTIFTLGIFGAWAMVRSKRYLYEHTELAGSRFSFQATGGSIFGSWFFLAIVYGVCFWGVKAPLLWVSSLIMLFVIFFFPYMLVQGTRYQTMMTSLNQMRFNFRATGMLAWWVMIGFPLIVFIALIVIFALFSTVAMNLGSGSIQTTAVIVVIASSLLYLPAQAVIFGIIVAKWLNFMGNGMEFGILKFKTRIESRKCFTIFLLSVAIYIPFFILQSVLILPIFLQILLNIGEPLDPMKVEQLGMMASGSILFGFFVYLIGVLVSYSFIINRLRCYFFESTTLEGKITFRSTTTFKGYLWMVVSNFFLIVFTLSLAYPWAKVRMVRYLTANTWVEGNLEALNSQDHDEQPPTDIISRLSRGISII